MVISDEKLKKWESLKETGDVEKIAELLDCSKETVHRIFNSGETTTERAVIIDKFFQKRQETIEKINGE